MPHALAPFLAVTVSSRVNKVWIDPALYSDPLIIIDIFNIIQVVLSDAPHHTGPEHSFALIVALNLYKCMNKGIILINRTHWYPYADRHK